MLFILTCSGAFGGFCVCHCAGANILLLRLYMLETREAECESVLISSPDEALLKEWLLMARSYLIFEGSSSLFPFDQEELELI